MAANEGADGKKELYTYQAPWLIYGMNWSVRPYHKYRLAIGSFLEAYSNKVQIIQLNETTGQFEVRGSFDHPYPTTKIAWMPDKTGTQPDLLATTGDYLRLWEVAADGSVHSKEVLNNNKNSEFCAPITSFDWNETNPNILGTSSIDTTCTIWDVNKAQAITQLIAHDKEVYDLAFARGTNIFASVGADGSLRLFDLRTLEHSTIVYESPELTPLLRLAWNTQDEYYLSTFCMDSTSTIILDIRVPSVPAAELSGHNAAINAVVWAPHSSCHLCTVGDDSQALIWDLSPMPKKVEDPILAYTADAEVNSLAWSAAQSDWVAITWGSSLQILRV